jgi:hypothetical protein
MVRLPKQATTAMASAWKEFAQQLPMEPALGIDDAPMKEGPIKYRFYTFVTITCTAFALMSSRAAMGLDKRFTARVRSVANGAQTLPAKAGKTYGNVARPKGAGIFLPAPRGSRQLRMVWHAKHVLVYLPDERGLPEEPYHLRVCTHPLSGEFKYFPSNAPADTPLERLLCVAFGRWRIERCFEDGKGEVGLDR